MHVTRGAVEVAGHPLKAGDGAKIAGETGVTLGNAESAELMLFDLP